jgi:hypothetical protein
MGLSYANWTWHSRPPNALALRYFWHELTQICYVGGGRLRPLEDQLAVFTERRWFVAAVVAATVAAPLAASAQRPKPISRVGALSPNAEASATEAAFVQEMHELGYVVGQNLLFDYRGAAEHADRLHQLAAELVAAKLDVIFASGSQATRAKAISCAPSLCAELCEDGTAA